MQKRIEVDCSVGPVGAVISGVDLSQDLEKEILEEIHQAWLRHHIVFFRDQDLTPPQQAAFGELFGEPIYEICRITPKRNSNNQGTRNQD